MPFDDKRLENYVPVNDRIIAFYKKHPQGSLQAELLQIDNEVVVMRAYAYRGPDDEKPGIGHAEERRGTGMVNRTSAVENCETSAWGRALASLGFDVRKGIASREEMEAVQRKEAAGAVSEAQGEPQPPSTRPAAGRSSASTSRKTGATKDKDVLANDSQHRLIFGRAASHALSEDELHYVLKKKGDVDSIKQLTKAKVDEVLAGITAYGEWKAKQTQTPQPQEA